VQTTLLTKLQTLQTNRTQGQNNQHQELPNTGPNELDRITRSLGISMVVDQYISVMVQSVLHMQCVRVLCANTSWMVFPHFEHCAYVNLKSC